MTNEEDTMAPFEVIAHASEHPAATARSVRRATARRTSTRRAYTRSRQSDSEASIIGFLANHPRSTIGDLAKALNLDPEHVATCLVQLTSAGEIQTASHGYTT
jgi:DNA-binding MarR family transcriptional regulator